MNKIFYLEQESPEQLQIADEMDLVIPQYLAVVEELRNQDYFEKIPQLVNNSRAYWKRLSYLFKQTEAFQLKNPSVLQAMQDSLQAELNSLESSYLIVNQRIQFLSQHWTEGMWNAAQYLLKRMDEVLEDLGFAKEHADRLLLQELLVEHSISQKKEWLTQLHKQPRKKKSA